MSGGMSTWEIFIEPPGDWVPLPVDPGVDAAAFATDQVTWLADDADRDLMVHQLSTFTRRAQELSAVVAGCLPTDGWSNVHAYVEVLVEPAGSTEELATDLDDLESALTPAASTWSEVSRPLLPAGEAVRVHLIDAEGATPQEQEVVESITYALPTPDGRHVAVVTMSWTDLATAEQMIELADDTAQTVRFSRAD